MASRDASGRPIAWWGCPACRTLNSTDDVTCHHCAAPRPRWRRLGQWMAVAAVLVIVALVMVQRSGRPSTPVADVLPAGPEATAPQSTTAESLIVATPADTIPPIGPAGPTTITWVNVRADPDRDARILGVLDPDTPVTILESDIGWHRVRAGALSGWVYAEGLTQP